MKLAKQRFIRRKLRVRTKIRKNKDKLLRLCVFRSNKHIYAQLIDDTLGKTLVAASSFEKDFKYKDGSNVDAAKEVGQLLAQRAVSNNISNVVFDKSGYAYHGKVKALADAARNNGLKF
jgi:large subunit ribosomal protein L18